LVGRPKLADDRLMRHAYFGLQGPVAFSMRKAARRANEQPYFDAFSKIIR
jgi:hypothetical protein